MKNKRNGKESPTIIHLSTVDHFTEGDIIIYNVKTGKLRKQTPFDCLTIFTRKLTLDRDIVERVTPDSIHVRHLTLWQAIKRKLRFPYE